MNSTFPVPYVFVTMSGTRPDTVEAWSCTAKVSVPAFARLMPAYQKKPGKVRHTSLLSISVSPSRVNKLLCPGSVRAKYPCKLEPTPFGVAGF